ncbi:hypothetical protein D3C85_1725420 [compost metagenome]
MGDFRARMGVPGGRDARINVHAGLDAFIAGHFQVVARQVGTVNAVLPARLAGPGLRLGFPGLGEPGKSKQGRSGGDES